MISFVWTMPAVLAGRKTVTRRPWKASHAKKFHEGDLIAAYTKLPRRGGRQAATLRLTGDAYEEPTSAIPASDFEAEGFAFLEQSGLNVDGLPAREYWEKRLQAAPAENLWVVRYELVEVIDEPAAPSATT